MYRVDVDLHNTNEDFAIDASSEGEALAIIDEAIRLGYVIQSRQKGAVKIYHPIASVKHFLVTQPIDKSLFAPQQPPRK